jgi:hypothetical protein
VSVDNPYPRRRDARTGELYYLHRAVAAWKLGRPLRPGEVVHHVNGDTTDNHPDNIWVFANQRAHMLFEHYQSRQARGVCHLFELEELLEREGLWVVR